MAQIYKVSKLTSYNINLEDSGWARVATETITYAIVLETNLACKQRLQTDGKNVCSSLKVVARI